MRPHDPTVYSNLISRGAFIADFAMGPGSGVLTSLPSALFAGIARTVGTGQELVAASEACAHLQELRGKDVQLLGRARDNRQVFTVPVALTELLGKPKLRSGVAKLLAQVPLAEARPG